MYSVTLTKKPECQFMQRLIFMLDELIRNMSLLWIGFSKEEIEEYPLY